MPSQTQTPATANSTAMTGDSRTASARDRTATSPEARSCSQMAPCATSMPSEISPARSAKGLSSGTQGEDERALVMSAQQFVQAEGHALQQVAEGDAEDQRRNGTAGEQPPVPGITPLRIVELRTVVEAHRPEEQGEQHEQHRHVEAGEGGGVNGGPGGEDGAAGGDQPHLVAVPVRADGVDGNPPLGVGLGDEGQERTHAHCPCRR